MDAKTKKILAIVGMAAGGFLLFSSFKGAETNIPVTDPGTDPGTGDETGGDIFIDPNDLSYEDTTIKIGGEYIIKGFKIDRVLNTGTLALEFELNQHGMLKVGDYVEVFTKSTNAAISSLINQKATVVEVYNVGNAEIITTTQQYPNRSDIKNAVNMYLNKLYFGSNRVKLLSHTAPSNPNIIVVNPGQFPILSIAPDYNPATGNNPNHCLIRLGGTNLANHLKAGDFIKLTIGAAGNQAYHNQTVKILAGYPLENNSTWQYQRLFLIDFKFAGTSGSSGFANQV